MRFSYKKTETGWAIHHLGHIEDKFKLLCCVEKGVDGWYIPMSNGPMGPYMDRWGAGQAYLKALLDPAAEKLAMSVEKTWKKNRIFRADRTLTEVQATAIYEVLVNRCKACEDERESFVYSHTRTKYISTEWRFCGILGFGGKFWNTDYRWYVSAYPENLDPETRLIVAETNEVLQGMYIKEFSP